MFHCIIFILRLDHVSIKRGRKKPRHPFNPDTFAEAFQAWATAALAGLSGEQVCVDGKTLRGSRDGATPGVHRISAFASRARWVLAQQKVGEKTNEITAIPDLLGLLDLHGATVSLEAMGGQKAIARTIVEGGADYVLALKDNHRAIALPIISGDLTAGRRRRIAERSTFLWTQADRSSAVKGSMPTVRRSSPP